LVLLKRHFLLSFVSRVSIRTVDRIPEYRVKGFFAAFRSRTLCATQRPRPGSVSSCPVNVLVARFAEIRKREPSHIAPANPPLACSWFLSAILHVRSREERRAQNFHREFKAARL